jgi:hypothetical protein
MNTAMAPGSQYQQGLGAAGQTMGNIVNSQTSVYSTAQSQADPFASIVGMGLGAYAGGFGGAMGFSLVLILFASMRERLEAADVPPIFQGAAIAMVTGGLMSLAFMGFAGLVR